LQKIRAYRMGMDTKTLEELSILVVAGDEDAHAELWVRIIPKVRSVVAGYARKSQWVDSIREDLEQGILLEYPKFIKRYDPAKVSKSYNFSNWLHHTLARIAQDVMRRQKDVLGVGIPQKAPYPEWLHLGAIDHCSGIINDGRENMRRGHKPCLEPDGTTQHIRPKYRTGECDFNYDGESQYHD